MSAGLKRKLTNTSEFTPTSKKRTLSDTNIPQLIRPKTNTPQLKKPDNPQPKDKYLIHYTTSKTAKDTQGRTWELKKPPLKLSMAFNNSHQYEPPQTNLTTEEIIQAQIDADMDSINTPKQPSPQLSTNNLDPNTKTQAQTQTSTDPQLLEIFKLSYSILHNHPQFNWPPDELDLIKIPEGSFSRLPRDLFIYSPYYKAIRTLTIHLRKCRSDLQLINDQFDQNTPLVQPYIYVPGFDRQIPLPQDNTWKTLTRDLNLELFTDIARDYLNTDKKLRTLTNFINANLDHNSASTLLKISMDCGAAVRLTPIEPYLPGLFWKGANFTIDISDLLENLPRPTYPQTQGFDYNRRRGNPPPSHDNHRQPSRPNQNFNNNNYPRNNYPTYNNSNPTNTVRYSGSYNNQNRNNYANNIGYNNSNYANNYNNNSYNDSNANYYNNPWNNNNQFNNNYNYNDNNYNYNNYENYNDYYNDNNYNHANNYNNFNDNNYNNYYNDNNYNHANNYNNFNDNNYSNHNDNNYNNYNDNNYYNSNNNGNYYYNNNYSSNNYRYNNNYRRNNDYYPRPNPTNNPNRPPNSNNYNNNTNNDRTNTGKTGPTFRY